MVLFIQKFFLRTKKYVIYVTFNNHAEIGTRLLTLDIDSNQWYQELALL